MLIFSAFFLFFRPLFVSKISLAMEILILRQQLLVLNRTVKRPKLHRLDRLFWICLSRLWKDWRDALIIDTQENGACAYGVATTQTVPKPTGVRINLRHR
jgi:hypothetical protein